MYSQEEAEDEELCEYEERAAPGDTVGLVRSPPPESIRK